MLTVPYVLVIYLCSGCDPVTMSRPMQKIECEDLLIQALKYEDVWPGELKCIEARLRIPER